MNISTKLFLSEVGMNDLQHQAFLDAGGRGQLDAIRGGHATGAELLEDLVLAELGLRRRHVSRWKLACKCGGVRL